MSTHSCIPCKSRQLHALGQADSPSSESYQISNIFILSEVNSQLEQVRSLTHKAEEEEQGEFFPFPELHLPHTSIDVSALDEAILILERNSYS
jgi:hypothetical protein